MPALVIAVTSFLAVFLKRSEEKITKKIKQKARPERERPK
jgi:hypothetical protein